MNDITKRFIECHDDLKKRGKIRSSRQFALQIDYLPQNLSEIMRGKRDVSMELLRRAIEGFRMNPLFLYTGEGEMFLDDRGIDTFRVLTIATDPDGDERILHVPVPAQAGYTESIHDPVFYADLPTFSLPDISFQSGTFRSFDVAGDSMEPTLLQGDKVVCSFIDPYDWVSSLKDNHVYVVVTRGSIMVKRIENNLQRHRHLALHSDNDYYKITRININDIREVWYVRARISVFSHLTPDSTTKAEDLQETLQLQVEETQRLHQLLQNIVSNSQIN